MRRLAVAVAVAVGATACGGAPTSSPWAVEESTTTTPADGAVTATARPDPIGAARGPGEVLDDECFDGEDRCGRILVPDRAGSPDRVALSFRLYASDAPGVPLVFLESGFGDFAPDDSTFPGRPVLVLGDRSTWPGGPAIRCPEWYDLDGDTPHDEAAAATARCAQRLRRAGITIEATGREQHATDVVTALRALGIDRLHLIAANLRADLVPAIAAQLDVDTRVLVEPSLAPADPVVRAVDRTVQSLEFAWGTCRALPDCAPEGSIREFLDLVDRLDDAPARITDPITGDVDEIDAEALVGALHREVDRPEAIVFLPTLHRALRDRDDDVIVAFVTSGSGGDARVDWLAQSCARVHATEADVAAYHPVLRRDALDTLAFFAAHCAEWYTAEAVDAGHKPGLVIMTESTPDRDRLLGLGAPAIVEPTIGSPSGDCIAAAVDALLAEEPIDVAECSEPFAVADRPAVELVPGEYVFDGGVVGLVVPSAWTDSGNGTWWREADPLDSTNLDVYALVGTEPDAARRDFVAQWGVSDAALSDTMIEGRPWLLAHGGDEADPTGRVRQVVAAGMIDEFVVVMVLRADAADVDVLVDEVLEPALAAARVD